MVQARGVARVRDDEHWLRQQITRLTETHESSREMPWHVADAPPAFIEAELRGIVGVETEIRVIDGKWKVSQNRRSRIATVLSLAWRNLPSSGYVEIDIPV